MVLKENGLGYHQVQPHCPDENGLIERANRTLRESLEGEELSNLLDAQLTMARLIQQYNEDRLHSALGYLPLREDDRGDPTHRFGERGVTLLQARHCRRQRNPRLRQQSLPLEARKVLTPTEPALCHFR
jgi:putative transposase